LPIAKIFEFAKINLVRLQSQQSQKSMLRNLSLHRAHKTTEHAMVCGQTKLSQQYSSKDDRKPKAHKKGDLIGGICL
jgi:hypothetical protein